MEELNAFEHQVADGLGVMGGPGRRIDPMAMARTVSTQSPKWRFQSMFSATKFVVAGFIVALFGGFLLSGVLTQPSEEQVPAVGASASASADATVNPTPAVDAYGDMRSGLVTKQIRPGIERIVADGAEHDFPPDQNTVAGRVVYSQIAFGPDGSAWMRRDVADSDVDAEVIRVGEPGSFTIGTAPGIGATDLAVAPDGTVWSLWTDNLVETDEPVTDVFRLEDGVWVKHDSGMDSRSRGALEILADGSVWVRDGRALRRLEANGSTAFPYEDAGIALPAEQRWVFDNDMAAAPDGTLWLAFDATEDAAGGLVRFDGRSWERVDPLGSRYQSTADAVAVGDGGVVWAALTACRGQGCLDDHAKLRHFLARYDGTTWTVLDEDDGVARTNAPGGWKANLAVSPDGLLLTSLDKPGTGSVALFDADGRVARLPRQRMGAFGATDIAAAPDGSFWVLDDGLYLITPEAVAAAE